MLYQQLLSAPPLVKWTVAFFISLLASLIVRSVIALIAKRFHRIAARTKAVWDDVIVSMLDRIKWGILFIWFFYGFSYHLIKIKLAKEIFWIVVVLLTVYQIALCSFFLLEQWKKNWIKKKQDKDPASISSLQLVHRVAQSVLIVTLVLVGLSQVGIDISALLAGLGVGGIAVALAAQNVLGDLLASLSIILDRPFVIGDFIIAGEEKGTVEQIGIKTTRLRSLSGEQLILSNKDLLESRIKNYKRMQTRRVVQQFGVIYSTNVDVLERIPAWIHEIVNSVDKLTFDRCHFCKYGNSSLDFEFVFYVEGAEYNLYMELQQKVLFAINRKFVSEGVEFAYPTQTIYLEKDN